MSFNLKAYEEKTGKRYTTVMNKFSSEDLFAEKEDSQELCPACEGLCYEDLGHDVRACRKCEGSGLVKTAQSDEDDDILNYQVDDEDGPSLGDKEMDNIIEDDPTESLSSPSFDPGVDVSPGEKIERETEPDRIKLKEIIRTFLTLYEGNVEKIFSHLAQREALDNSQIESFNSSDKRKYINDFIKSSDTEGLRALYEYIKSLSTP